MSSEPYTLYHYYKSICSLMVRYTIVLAESGNPSPSMHIVEQSVHLPAGDQMTEHFLFHVNPKGQVPVLTHPTLLSHPIADSLDITKYFFAFYPNLSPSPHASEVSRLLTNLHALNFFTLSFGDKPQVAKGQEQGTLRLISAPGISAEYQKALEYKLKVFQTEKSACVVPTTIAAEEVKTQKFLAEVSALKAKSEASGSPWVLGTAEPTALDAHLLVFLARLCEVNRANMLDDVMMSFHNKNKDSEIWKGFMKGESTF